MSASGQARVQHTYNKTINLKSLDSEFSISCRLKYCLASFKRIACIDHKIQHSKVASFPIRTLAMGMPQKGHFYKGKHKL